MVSVFCGARLVLIPSVMFATPPALLDYLCENQVTVLIWAASALCVVSAARGLEYRVPKGIRMIFFSGEIMPFYHLKLWREALPETVHADLAHNNAYWSQFRNSAAQKVSNKVYDSMLKAYGDQRGIQSYGTVVDLLVAYYK